MYIKRYRPQFSFAVRGRLGPGLQRCPPARALVLSCLPAYLLTCSPMFRVPSGEVRAELVLVLWMVSTLNDAPQLLDDVLD